MVCLRLEKSTELSSYNFGSGNSIASGGTRERRIVSSQSVFMRSTAVGKSGQSPSRTSSCASLSVVVVSTGSVRTTERATQALQAASRDLVAQFIVVAQSRDQNFATSVQRSGAEFVVAPPGCSRAEMCDLGMSQAVGNIVAVRDDTSVGNAEWLDVYRRILPQRESPIAPVETVVMDTMVATRTIRADGAADLEAGESGRSDPSIELAEAV